MSGRIDREGMLFLNRNGVLVQQVCPHSSPSVGCGDWCPRFQEPKNNAVVICGDTMLMGVVDKRGEMPRLGTGALPGTVTAKLPRKVWQRLDCKTLACPDCGRTRGISEGRLKLPRTCKGCGAKLDLE